MHFNPLHVLRVRDFLNSTMFKYSDDLYHIGKKTIYVTFNDIRVGWIAARQEYEWGKIYFCYNPRPKKTKRLGALYNAIIRLLFLTKLMN